MTNHNPRSDMATLNQVLEAAKLAVETYFHGDDSHEEDKSMANLAAAIRDYESKQETVRIIKHDTHTP